MKKDAGDKTLGDCNKNHNNDRCVDVALAIKERFQGTAPRKKEYYVLLVVRYWLTMRRLSSTLSRPSYKMLG